MRAKKKTPCLTKEKENPLDPLVYGIHWKATEAERDLPLAQSALVLLLLRRLRVRVERRITLGLPRRRPPSQNHYQRRLF